MKATGIVRKIDDLGRIVIPKEIRRTLRIDEGDPLEIYVDSIDNIEYVMLRKFQTEDDILKTVKHLEGSVEGNRELKNRLVILEELNKIVELLK